MTEIADRKNGLPFRRYAHHIYALGQRIVAWAIRSLSNTDQPMLGYVWRAWLIAIIPAILISVVVNLVFGSLDWGRLASKGSVSTGPPAMWVVATAWVVGMVLLNPWLETLLMWPILRVLKLFIPEQLWVAVVSAWLWGGFHSLLVPGWGITTAWGFFIFSVCFLEWEKKSTGRAIIVTASVHMCQNAVPAILVVTL